MHEEGQTSPHHHGDAGWDQVRAFNAAKRFVKEQMTSADLVAIMAFTSGSVQVIEDFTADRARLLSTMETLIVGEDENAPPDAADASRADAGAAFGQNVPSSTYYLRTGSWRRCKLRRPCWAA